MTKSLIAVLAVLSSAFLISTPAFATKGIDAARTCNANPKCLVTYFDDGSITILMGDTFVECAGPQAECKVLSIRPTSSGGIKPAAGSSKR